MSKQSRLSASNLSKIIQEVNRKFDEEFVNLCEYDEDRNHVGSTENPEIKSFITEQIRLAVESAFEYTKLTEPNESYYKNIYPPQSRWKEGWQDAIEQQTKLRNNFLNT